MRTFVEYGGIVFSGRGHLVEGDSAGYGIVRNGLSGFHSSAASTAEELSRPGGDGSFATASYLGGKVRGITGRAFARSESELIELETRLKAVRNGGAWQTLTFTRGNVVRRALAQVNGEVDWEHDPWVGNNARFLLSLRSADPWWLGEESDHSVSAGGSVTVVNRGTEPASPTAVVTGPIAAGWSILGFTVNRAVASSETVTVDSATGSVDSSTAGELMRVVSGFPRQIPVGVSTVTFSAVGTGSAVVTFADTFL